MLYDKAKIFVEGGAGGNGSISFRREAHVPRGGPDGGDGGHGGGVLLECDPSRRDLGALRSKHFRAGRGHHGEGSNKQGARGEDLVIHVPPGTQASSVDGALIDLTEPGQTAVLARGGRGGHGNKRFSTSVRQAPRFAENGTSGESGWVELRLKLLADAGLIGLPNAGKSSLLSRLTRADPKVADYPFTTLEPVLGTIETPDRQVVLADIPGLIEGAAEGAGLGHEFLAHVERCAMLIHVVELAPSDGEPLANYRAVRAELAAHSTGLENLPELLVLSKSDLWTEADIAGQVEEWDRELGEAVLGVIPVSAATGAGLERLTESIVRFVPDHVEVPVTRDADGLEVDFEAEHLTYRPKGEGGYSVEEEESGVFRIHGHGIEVLFERFDVNNEEALGYLETRLTEIGVMAELKRAGFESGNEIRVGEYEFELY
ncbi:MAG: GTPase ObgE [Solirubrobacterales bacterium]|nr:GTPase ObgE [Solirubrobacterales bacterium]HMT04001.1 GTPase ObgE [Solirubrobacterales bacterium]